MKKIYLVAIVILVVGLMVGCAAPQIKKSELIPKTDSLVIKEINIWKKWPTSVAEAKIVKPEAKDDEDGRKLISEFRTSFCETLAKKGIVVRETETPILVGVRVDLFYKIQFGIPLPHRFLVGKVTMFVEEKPILTLQGVTLYSVLALMELGPGKLGERLAEATAKQLGAEK